MILFTYTYCTYQHKINRYPRALQFVTDDFCVDQIFSRFFLNGRSRSGTLGTVWAQTGMFRLKLLINFLSLLIVGLNWLARLGRSTQDSIIPALKPGGSLAPSSRPFQLAHVPGMVHVFVPTISEAYLPYKLHNHAIVRVLAWSWDILP